jgi:ubiquinone/menaquinone biosynthesis C-methylase UbiE
MRIYCQPFFGRSLMPMSDPFLAPYRSPQTCDNFWIRKAILQALTHAMKSFAGTLLDVGSGVMPYRSFILENSKVTRYIGLDFPAGKYADQVFPDLVWNGLHIPLEEAAVECVMATEVLEHCPDPYAVINEIHRVLKPGGSFFFTVPFLWPLHDNPYDEYRYTPFSLHRLLEGVGFCNIDIRASGGWDASLAQMLGLWLRRNPMSEAEREDFIHKLYPFYEQLLQREEQAMELTMADMKENSIMIAGLWGMAFKAQSPGRSKEEVQCPICGLVAPEFLPYGTTPRPNALCPSCGSLERHRLLWFFLKERTNLFKGGMRILDIAPTKGLSEQLAANRQMDYLSIDRDSILAMRKMDITALELPDNHFDCLLCYHVLEHIPEDGVAMHELFRVLKPGGWAIIQVPIDKRLPQTLEGAHISDPAERARLFGQADHVRTYGLDYKCRLGDAGFSVRVDHFAMSLSAGQIKRYALHEWEEIYVCSKPF